MFTAITYQDWEATPEGQRLELLPKIIEQYKAGEEFKRALTAAKYFNGTNPPVMSKTIMERGMAEVKTADGATRHVADPKPIIGARVPSNFLFRFVTQQNQFLLSNGVTLDEDSTKERLGIGFDKTLEAMGEKALLHGVCWGFWNVDHVEALEAARDEQSGFVALLDEETSAPRLGVQFWRLTADKPLYVRLFELDGVTVYRKDKDELVEYRQKQAYKLTVATDAVGSMVTSAENYATLPIIPLYANAEQRSELTESIKAKIDAYDRITSDFVDNFDRANDVYWVLNNFGGTLSDMIDTINTINQLKLIANQSDGVGSSSTASPYTIEVPHEARKNALELLEKALYKDYMALSMDEMTGGSLTNVAIQAAMTNLNLKTDRYEWQVFSFVQQLLALLGVESEEIRFHRQEFVNRSEIVDDIQAMRQDIDDETALKLNPYIMPEEIDGILANRDAKILTGLSGTDAANRARGADNGQGDS